MKYNKSDISAVNFFYLFFFIMPFFIIFTIQCSKATNDLESVKIEENKALTAKINYNIKTLKNELVKSKTDYEKMVICTDIAKLYLQKGDINNIQQYANKAATYQPNSYLPYYVAGLAFTELCRYTDAEEKFNIAINLKPDHAESYFSLGNIFYKQCRYEQALNAYKKALSLKKNYVDVMNNLANIYIIQKNYKMAESLLLKMIASKSDFAPAYKNIALLYDVKLFNKTKALQYYKLYMTQNIPPSEKNKVLLWIKYLESTK